MLCGVCGSGEFTSRDVLWAALVDEWQLSPAEASYVNRQQGTCCSACGANLRSIALANALRSVAGVDAFLRDAVALDAFRSTALLEINEAGSLTQILCGLPNYRFVSYPEVDMHALPFADGTFDVVVHSDTLEHVPNPTHALTECRRVLRDGGALCFTVPIIVGRLSCSRRGRSPSYHGNPLESPDDFIVQTEFGADAWTLVMEAGFSRVELHAVDYPSGLAMLARK